MSYRSISSLTIIWGQRIDKLIGVHLFVKVWWTHMIPLNLDVDLLGLTRKFLQMERMTIRGWEKSWCALMITHRDEYKWVIEELERGDDDEESERIQVWEVEYCLEVTLTWIVIHIWVERADRTLRTHIQEWTTWVNNRMTGCWFWSALLSTRASLLFLSRFIHSLNCTSSLSLSSSPFLSPFSHTTDPFDHLDTHNLCDFLLTGYKDRMLQDQLSHSFPLGENRNEK